MPNDFVYCGGVWVHIVQFCARVCAVPGWVCASRGCARWWSTAGQGGCVNTDQQTEAWCWGCLHLWSWYVNTCCFCIRLVICHSCLIIATHSPRLAKSLGKGSVSCTSMEISSTKSWLISCRSFTLSLCAAALILQCLFCNNDNTGQMGVMSQKHLPAPRREF